ncbi:MAG: hypothetical protein MRERC_2c005 [Mycoplasmataceae bacterium RC_NB112A]|nr:MAG: hypothetical protein MRERC_6c096 [Mycoplasmataceae bacterium RC_NB112A]KLL02134.1 MAG: hypothetical protein MRERC_4c094 [Mycoplasmataceae bacterium RC_NB112A]KLL02174.1 MAG: hypothetical protein MRERC_4c148 [Mycoplasmataceae bacterium RC_NB112A]KLL02296.1 MAG: hypothetical protein MRERC_2c005 [Mycoplasmataceae bacterium RC_NB112A]
MVSVPLDNNAQLFLLMKMLGELITEIKDVNKNLKEIVENHLKPIKADTNKASAPPPPPPMPDKRIDEIKSKLENVGTFVKDRLNTIDARIISLPTIKSGGSPEPKDIPIPKTPLSSPPLKPSTSIPKPTVGRAEVLEEIRRTVKKKTNLEPFRFILGSKTIDSCDSTDLEYEDISVEVFDNDYEANVLIKGTLLFSFKWEPYKYLVPSKVKEKMKEVYKVLEIRQTADIILTGKVDVLLRTITNQKDGKLIPYDSSKPNIEIMKLYPTWKALEDDLDFQKQQALKPKEVPKAEEES